LGKHSTDSGHVLQDPQRERGPVGPHRAPPVRLPEHRGRGPAGITLALVIAAACTAEAPRDAAIGDRDPPVETAAPPTQSRVYERRLVFLTLDADSTLAVPWFFTSRSDPEGVTREIRGWLVRNGSWEPFFREGWRSAPTRAPWRQLPRGRLRLVVGLGDALERIVYEDGPRQLEVGFGGLLAEWTSPSGGVHRLHEASAVLSNRRVNGVLLDLNRTRPPGDTHGDWVFLVSGDSLQMVVDGVRPSQVPLGGAEGWARLDFRQLTWPRMSLEWSEVRAFERARRDVPTRWRIQAADGSVEGTLGAVTNEIEAGRGSGPLLPVYALFEVEGDVRIDGVTYPVRGILHHRQN